MEGPGTAALLRKFLAVGWYWSHGQAPGWPLCDSLCWFDVKLLLRNNLMPSCYFPQLLKDLQTHCTFLPHCLSCIHRFCLPAVGGNFSRWSLLVAREKGKHIWPFFQPNKGIYYWRRARARTPGWGASPPSHWKPLILQGLGQASLTPTGLPVSSWSPSADSQPLISLKPHFYFFLLWGLDNQIYAPSQGSG